MGRECQNDSSPRPHAESCSPPADYRALLALGDSDRPTHYCGKMVANLASSDGKHMRCKFQLMDPQDGMSGGGQGQCQLPRGKTIDTPFPKV
jgi:hypothetical protein